MSGIYGRKQPVKQSEAIACQVDFSNFSDSSEEETPPVPEVAKQMPKAPPKHYDRNIRSMSSQTEEAKRTNVPLETWNSQHFQGVNAIGSDDLFGKKEEPTIKDMLRDASNEGKRFLDKLLS